MKKIFFGFTAFVFLTVTQSSCKKTLLDQQDPNSPNPRVLNSEIGLTALGAGILQRSIYDVPNAGNSNILSIAMATQSILGDETFIGYGNFGWRWVDQVYKITLPDGTVVTDPFGVTQKESLQGFNNRSAADRNAFFYEWTVCYLFNDQANHLLQEVPTASFTGDADEKRKIFNAWAYWWKGFSYSRLGSMYIAGVISNESGVVNHDFVDHNAIIAEANVNFDKCAGELSTLSPDGDDDYTELMGKLILSFNDNVNIPTPAMWLRAINSYKARNLMVNKKVADMATSDWQQVLTLATDGLKSTDNYFKFGMTPDGNNDLSNGFLHPLALTNPNNQYEFISERLVQDFKPNDSRFARDILQLPYPPDVDDVYGLSAFANLRARGLQFGTRWAAKLVEDGGAFASGSTNAGTVPFGCSYEENALMLAEANLYTNNIEAGLGYIDEVRDYQNSSLAHVAGTGLTLAAAKEELRKERRIGLALRGLAFFDARRWGITAPAANGGGRADAIVYVPASLNGTALDVPQPCFMDYNYMDYWDVPQNELDFNAPAGGSAQVKN